MAKWLRERHARKLTAKQMMSQKFRIRTSGRSTDVPPAIAPYNFGINQEWLDARKDTDEYRALLADWGNYPGPPGFDPPVPAEDDTGDAQDRVGRDEEDDGDEDEDGEA